MNFSNTIFELLRLKRWLRGWYVSCTFLTLMLPRIPL
jgi:hypothetical protein